jgi:hypothetical protein
VTPPSGTTGGSAPGSGDTHDEPTHYDILGVDPAAGPGEIRSAYVELARRHHPDLAGDNPTARRVAERRMQEINQAWSVLGDATRRATYDRDLAALRRSRWTAGTVTPDFVPYDDSVDPEDPAAEHDVPYGDGAPVPRSLQMGPGLVVVVGLVVLGLGILLGFGPLVALGVVAMVAGVLGFVAAPVYAVLRSSRTGLD